MAEQFPQQVQDLQLWVAGRTWQGVAAQPLPPADAAPFSRVPELWVLGSSNYGAQLAAQLGLPYAFAYFFMDGEGVDQALHLYRTLYQPSERHPQPHCTVCVWALAARDEDEARHHAMSRERWRVDRARGLLGPLQAPAEVAERGFAPEELPMVEAMRQKSFVGTAAQVARQLRDLASALELDELVINTWAHDPQVRRRSYELLAAELLPGAAG
jgi:luciferase family oxidoreductase group 1